MDFSVKQESGALQCFCMGLSLAFVLLIYFCHDTQSAMDSLSSLRHGRFALLLLLVLNELDVGFGNLISMHLE